MWVRQMNSTHCCGSKLKTRFCPNCGKPNEHPLQGLLKYCLTQLKTTQTRLKNEGHRSSPRVNMVKSFTAGINRWNDWSVALGKIIEKELPGYSKHLQGTPP